MGQIMVSYLGYYPSKPRRLFYAHEKGRSEDRPATWPETQEA